MMEKGAKFSDCGRYRYLLYRIWNRDKPLIMYVGLNPSTANAVGDDNTIRKLYKLTESNGYGGFYMANLFAFISPYPKDLQTCADPVADNDLYYTVADQFCSAQAFCWGAFDETIDRARELISRYPNALCFGANKNGSPKHPLYLKSNTTLSPYTYI